MKHTIFSHRFRWRLPLRAHTALPSAPLCASDDTPPLQLLAQQPPAQWPECVRRSALATKYLRLLGALDWRQLPPRPGGRAWPGPAPAAVTPYLIALLIRVDQQLPTMGALVRLLHQQPELAWLAGFPPTGQPYQGAPPTTTSLSQVLRRLPNAVLQALLDQTVHLLARHLPPEPPFGETVVFDTKHILAWVKENNPKTYIRTGRFDKTQQPKGDPDCKLGCKRRHNQTTTPAASPPTPKAEGQRPPRQGVGTGEFYWGYASGIVVTKAPLWGEFVLAELTQTFDQSDVSYFAPLLAQVERRLGRRPRFGAGDAAFDAHYIYDYFHEAGGLAAIPTGARTSGKERTFAPDGRLLCAAGLPMTLLGVFQNRTSRVVHERQRWGCPLLLPTPTGDTCPQQDDHWAKGGCRSTIASTPGARLRHQIDRQSAAYQAIYKQRTACERIFSQAVALGIERPKLRNGRSIANYNTLIYVLLNLRALQRVRAARAHAHHN